MTDFDLGQFQQAFVEAVIQQQSPAALLQHMVPTRSRSAEMALKTYQRDYSARLSDVLIAHFSSSHYIVGDTLFFQLCEAYLQNFRSQHYDLGKIVQAWPDFVLQHPLSQEFPFLADLARWENILDSCFHEAVILPCDLSPLNQVSDPDQLCFEFIPSLTFFQSPYPILKLWRLCNEAERSAQYPALDEASWLIAFKTAQGLRHTQLTALQFALLQSLAQGLSLGASFNALADHDSALIAEALPHLFALLQHEALVQSLSVS